MPPGRPHYLGILGLILLLGCGSGGTATAAPTARPTAAQSPAAVAAPAVSPAPLAAPSASASPVVAAAPGRAPDFPPKVRLDPVARGLEQPTDVTNAHDGSGRLFVVEKGGRVLIVRDGNARPTPFL